MNAPDGVKLRSTEDKFEDAFESPDPEKDKKPAKKTCPSVLLLYRQLYLLRASLAYVSPKMAKTQDKMLASIGYPAKFLGYVLAARGFAAGSVLSGVSNTISDYRTLSRVVATPATVKGSLDQILDNQNPDKLDRIGDYINAVCDTAYQLLEDLAYLASKKVINVSTKTENQLWAVSSMFWTAQIFLVLLRIPYYHYKYKTPVSVRQLVVNLAWTPLAIHWSTETGLLSNGWIGFLGTIANWPNMVYMWRNA